MNLSDILKGTVLVLCSCVMCSAAAIVYKGDQVAEKLANSNNADAAHDTSLQAATFLEPDVNNLLWAHNSKRALHYNTPSLSWDNTLRQYAEDQVRSLIGTEYDPCTFRLKHSYGPYGENIGTIGSSARYPRADEVVNAWYEEIKYYNFNDVTGTVHNGYDVGHFTQLVWADTTKVGCAVVTCRSQYYFVYTLCEYSPPGNVLDGTPGIDTYHIFKENVRGLI
ncbi:uncharacterized protein Ecym_1054 [Eremothecium cymbalariae DBVPG|uniref:SCP domain-containing protein n=1 Tax=Eremothecium cymbalariae (strain CBS 270.75 / DBVPG 7215 / KCTC 17166 / NRRL Y-17582) TaxID=931890 RepID=G8JMA3_ERECY|nr:hypothetical protein Ecym_1054 [Eremothecium cymbalariae DBVPG\